MSKKISLSMRVPNVEDSPLPDSRTLGAQNPEDQIRRVDQLKDTHIGGVPFAEWAELFPDQVNSIAYAMTDEGIVMLEELDRRRAMTLPSGAIASDPDEKGMIERRDFQMNNFDPLKAPDQRKKLADRYVKPGMRPKFINPRNVDAGMDPRGWEVVKKEDGSEVKHGNSVLAVMPEEQAAHMQRAKREVGNAQVREMYGTGRPVKRGGEDVRVFNENDNVTTGMPSYSSIREKEDL